MIRFTHFKSAEKWNLKFELQLLPIIIELQLHDNIIRILTMYTCFCRIHHYEESSINKYRIYWYEHMRTLY